MRKNYYEQDAELLKYVLKPSLRTEEMYIKCVYFFYALVGGKESWQGHSCTSVQWPEHWEAASKWESF